MRNLRTFAFAFWAATVGPVPAWAFAASDANTAPPTQHQLDRAPSQPYAMNYSDEAAQTLGVKDGKWEAFDTHSRNPLIPSLKGGIDHGGAMISLQWRPGQ